MFHDIMGLERALPWLTLAFGIGYLSGSIPFGVLVSKAFGLGDLRKIGSGNIGATNVLRTGNKAAATSTLLLDAMKGMAPVLVLFSWGDLAAQAAGLGAFVGHCYPIWLKFKGGKGVATFIGIVIGLNLTIGVLVCMTWLAAAAVTRMSSVAALSASASTPIWFLVAGQLQAVLLAILLASLIWVRHHENIRRILRSEEPKIGRR